MTRATPMAAWTAFLAKSSPSAASTEMGPRTQKRTCSPVPVIGGPLGGVAGGLAAVLDGVDALHRVAGGGLAGLRLGVVLPDPALLLGRGLGDLALVVVALLHAVDHGVRRGEHPLLERGQQALLGEDEVATGVVGELVEVRHRQRARGARLDAQAAEDAAQVVDLVDAAVALAGAEPGVLGVVRALDEDRVRGAGPGAELAAHALLQAVGVAVELVAAMEARLRRTLLLRVLLGLELAEHRGERDAESADRGEQVGEEATLRGVRVPLRVSHGWPPCQ